MPKEVHLSTLVTYLIILIFCLQRTRLKFMFVYLMYFTGCSCGVGVEVKVHYRLGFCLVKGGYSCSYIGGMISPRQVLSTNYSKHKLAIAPVSRGAALKVRGVRYYPVFCPISALDVMLFSWGKHFAVKYSRNKVVQLSVII